MQASSSFPIPHWFAAPCRIATVLGTVTLSVAGCGQSVSSPAGESEVGLTCGDVRPVESSAVEVEEAPECGDGYCLHAEDVARGARESTGMCSCRCDGPPGSGPFCACGEGFVCRKQVEDLGLEPSPLTGSYCVPSD
jgi:hypothetical protein